MYCLRKRIWAGYVVAAGLLALVILLGVRQHLLSGQYARIIDQSEKAIFHFATIREEITVSLIDKRWQRLERVVPEMEKLNSELVRLQESPLVPTGFKLAMVDKVDLAGMIISMRRLKNCEDDPRESKALQERLRETADHLLRYERIIASEARVRLLDFQLVIIGAMGCIISLAAFALNRLYRGTVVPLLWLTERLRSQEGQLEEWHFDSDESLEIHDLLTEIRALSSHAGHGAVADASRSGASERALLAETVNETANRLNGIINYAQILADDADSARSSEEREMLRKIIDNGVEIAASWQKIR